MSKADKEVVTKPEPKSAPEPQTGCVVCGLYSGALVAVAGAARAHESCSTERPDVIAKVRARA